MRSPGRAHPPHNPMVPAGPHRSGHDWRPLSRPGRLSIMAAVLLFVSSPRSPGPHNAHAHPPHALLVPPHGMERGVWHDAMV